MLEKGRKETTNKKRPRNNIYILPANAPQWLAEVFAVSPLVLRVPQLLQLVAVLQLVL